MSNTQSLSEIEASCQANQHSISNNAFDTVAAAVNVEEDEVEPSDPADSLVSYGLSWISFVLSAAFIALISNGVFGVPLYQVVDVQLSLFLTWAGLFIVVWTLFAAYDLYHWDLPEVFGDLAHVLAFAFLPFGTMTGYAIYGWMGGVQVHGASFVFDGYFAIYVDAYKYIASVFGDILGAVSTVQTTKGDVLTLDSDVLLKWTQIISGSLAALDVLRRWLTNTASAEKR